MGTKRNETQLRAALAARPKVGLQHFEEGAVLHPENDLYAPFANLGDRVTLVERFERKPGINGDIQNAAEAVRMIANPNFEVLGTNMTSALSTRHAQGGILMTTAGALNDQGILAPHLDANQSPWTGITWDTEMEPWLDLRIRTTTIADIIIWLGLKLTNTPVIATDADQVFLRFEAGVDTNWNLVSSNNGTDTEQDTGVVVAAATVYRVRFIVDADFGITVLINGKRVAHTASLRTGINLIPYVGIQDATALGAAQAIAVHHAAISKVAA